ncbi:MAG: DsbA family oxidoreductase [Spirosomataceae bacterium]
MTKPIQIDIVSDVACPWCYIGKKRLEAALQQLPENSVQITWRPFQLDPTIPMEGLDRDVYFEKKFGQKAKVAGIFDQVTQAGEQVGISFAFDRMPKVMNTLPLHQILQVAGEENFKDALEERFFQAYFENGEDLSDFETVAKILEEYGWDREKTATCWQNEALKSVVLNEIEQYQQAGVSGVPFFILANKYGISGAQPPEVFVQAIKQVMEEAKAMPETAAEAASCDPAKGCC